MELELEELEASVAEDDLAAEAQGTAPRNPRRRSGFRRPDTSKNYAIDGFNR